MSLRILNVSVANFPGTWNLHCESGTISTLSPHIPDLHPEPFAVAHVNAGGSLLLPSLSHAHVHLDKCFIFDRIEVIRGDFKEALEQTALSKSKFEAQPDDLLERGRRLITQSADCGVTSLRAHVEVDDIVRFTCFEAALLLKREFENICDVHIALFAQEPLFGKDEHLGDNHRYLVEAAKRQGVSAIGSAPYVEASVSLAKKNIDIVFGLAIRHSLHVDLHLDYNLDPSTEPLIYHVIETAKALNFSELCPTKRITIGHATRLQLFSRSEWRTLVDLIGDLPITLTGLPHSDLYMQGRESSPKPLGAPRGTLRVPDLAEEHGLHVAMGVNNVQNAFTPQGSLDPLSLCTLGVAIFQTATPKSILSLLESVTITAKVAIGESSAPKSLTPAVGDPADFVILHGTRTIQEAVLNPSYDRTTIKSGRVVATRKTLTWRLGQNQRR